MSYDTAVANKENFTFRFDPDLIAQIDVQAKAEHRSRTNMLEVMAADYLRRRESSKDNSLPLPQGQPSQ